MPCALVFAGTSFVGRHLCPLLRENGVEVIATSRQGRDDTCVCDLTERDSVQEIIERTRPDWIVQCGAATASSSARDHYAVHVTGALNVLEAAREWTPDAGILFFGSAAEYGPVSPEDLPVPETYLCRPTSFFGASKLAQTQLAIAAAATSQQRITVVRPFNIIGPGLPDHYFAAALTARLLKQKAELAAGRTLERTFEVHNPDATRDFVDVRDVANAVYRLLNEHPAEPGVAEVFNVSTGIETSILDAARQIGEALGDLVAVPAGDVDSRGGISRSAGDSQRLRKLGWHLRFDGLRDYAANVNQ